MAAKLAKPTTVKQNQTENQTFFNGTIVGYE
jgi:hypothetical protein